MPAVADALEIDLDLLEKLAVDLGVRRLWLFGSAARGELRDDSDVDVLVEWQPHGPRREAYLVKDQFPPAFGGRDVDLVECKLIPMHVGRRIERDRKLIYNEGRAMAPDMDANDGAPTTPTTPTGRAEPEERDLGRLCDMLESARQMAEWAAVTDKATMLANPKERMAWLHVVQIIGEAATKVSKATRGQLPAVNWTDATGMRHRIVHDYNKIDYNVLYGVATTEMRPLIDALSKFLDDRGVDCAAMDEPWKP